MKQEAKVSPAETLLPVQDVKHNDALVVRVLEWDVWHFGSRRVAAEEKEPGWLAPTTRLWRKEKDAGDRSQATSAETAVFRRQIQPANP